VLKDSVDFIFASPKGGEAPLDPGSKDAFASDEHCASFLQNNMDLVKDTVKLSDLSDDQISSIDAVLIPGGHGPMYDLVSDIDSHRIISTLYESGKYVASVCHGPAAIVDVRLSNGTYLVQGKNVTSFTNTEEDIVQLSDAMPFMLETKLIENGASFSKASEPWGSNVVVDGNLITGQNPASSTALGTKLLQCLLSK
jgi:putative intracellular protease/amidase